MHSQWNPHSCLGCMASDQQPDSCLGDLLYAVTIFGISPESWEDLLTHSTQSLHPPAPPTKEDTGK